MEIVPVPKARFAECVFGECERGWVFVEAGGKYLPQPSATDDIAFHIP